MNDDTLSEVVYAYGGSHWTYSYEAAEALAFDAKDNGATMNLARVSEDAFELLCFADNWRMDSEYVSLSVGRRLYQAGLVGAMVLWTGPDDEPKTEEEWKAREHREVYGKYVDPMEGVNEV